MFPLKNDPQHALIENNSSVYSLNDLPRDVIE